MYKHILVAVDVDFRNRIEPSLSVARALLGSGGKITLLHVVDEIPSYIAAQIPDQLIEHKTETMQTELAKLAASSGENVAAAVEHGHASREILDYAEGHGCDCVVVASHRPGLEDYFLGSTAARVVRHAPCSVHVIR